MVDFLFDGPNKIITEPAGTGDTTFDVEQDLYSAWKRWVTTGVGAPFLPAFSVEGGTPIGATGLFTGTTFILVNGWKVRAASHDHQLFLVGNLYSDDGVVVSPTSGFSTSVTISASVAAQGVASGSALTATQATRLEELWRMRGLDQASPVTVTESEETAGGIALDITGDGVTTSTLTRRP